MNRSTIAAGSLTAVLACLAPGLADAAAAARAASAAAPDSVVLRGGSEGTVFHTLTVEGEDRVHLEIERPTLSLDLDPSSAPGLELGGAQDVLDRTRPDLVGPLFAAVAAQPSPYTGRPWLDELATGPVARFRPMLTNVESWKLVVSSGGRTTATYEGKGTPPREIDWDGRGVEGSIALPGLRYSYVLEARDRAGNHRHFMGEEFEVPAYRHDTEHGPLMVLPGAAVDGRAAGAPGAAPPALLEVASWLNQMPVDRPVEVAVVARSQDRAATMAHSVGDQLAKNLLGDPARIRERTIVRPEAPAGDAVVILSPER